jgi:hypothetical protein
MILVFEPWFPRTNCKRSDHGIRDPHIRILIYMKFEQIDVNSDLWCNLIYSAQYMPIWNWIGVQDSYYRIYSEL